MMKIFTCRICGEVYIGREMPHTCPFCGVANKNLRLSSVWADENVGVDLTDLSRQNLETSLQIELSNAAFYKSAYEKLKENNLAVALMFKGLFKVEREHASVFRKLLGKSGSEDAGDEASSDPIACIEESGRREARAIELYERFAVEATEERVKNVFVEIAGAEKDHLEMDGDMKSKIKSK